MVDGGLIVGFSPEKSIPPRIVVKRTKVLTACQDKVALVFVQWKLPKFHGLAHHGDVRPELKQLKQFPISKNPIFSFDRIEMEQLLMNVCQMQTMF